jgi:hypothetical protein
MGLAAAAFPIALAVLPSPHLWPLADVTRQWCVRVFAAVVCLTGAWVGVLVFVGSATDSREQVHSKGSLHTAWLKARPNVKPGVMASAETVTVFPWDLSYAIQKGFPISNLPVIQSYAACSPRLTALNANFLEGATAPRRVYLEIAPIDDRYPTLEDPLSWRSLVTHYRPGGMNDGFLILERTDPRKFQLSPVLHRKLTMGETLTIPSDSHAILWAVVSARLSWFGRAVSASVRAPSLLMRVGTSSAKEQFAFPYQVSESGFFLSPLVESPAAIYDFYNLSGQPRVARKVESISFSEPDRTRGSFSREIDVRLYEFTMPGPHGRDVVEIPGSLTEGTTYHMQRGATN